MPSIDQLVKELREATDAELIERVRWLEEEWGLVIRADPRLLKRFLQARDDFYERKRIEFDRAERPLIKDLRRAGIDVKDVYDLVNTNNQYDQAIPVLLDHSTRDYPDVIREGIYRSLCARFARDIAWGQVFRAYLAEPNKSQIAGPGEVGTPSGPKEGMAIALSGMAAPADLPTLVELITDPKNGPSRIFFIANLVRSRSPLAFDTLASLSNDPELKTEIAIRLKAKMLRQARKRGSAARGTDS